ncbi:MAG TPA: PIG-L deacetylase family protein [Usitatibacter sp.]|nr:PIG-L deacetylase family protein [Usitatibacter sp.]
MKRACAAEVRPARQSIASRYQGQTVVAIGAHPDDLEIGLGGTLARLQRDGARVIMCVASIPKDFDVRLEEAKRGAEILGCELRIMMPDGPKRLEDLKTYELVGMIDGIIREYEPAAVFTHSSADFHNDHLLIYNACLPTQRLAYFDLFSYHPTNCRPVPIAFHPKAYVDITDTIDAKMHSITAHASQFGGRGLDTEMYREFAHVQGRMIGVPYAEGLDVVRMLLN